MEVVLAWAFVRITRFLFVTLTIKVFGRRETSSIPKLSPFVTWLAAITPFTPWCPDTPIISIVTRTYSTTKARNVCCEVETMRKKNGNLIKGQKLSSLENSSLQRGYRSNLPKNFLAKSPALSGPNHSRTQISIKVGSWQTTWALLWQLQIKCV